MISFVSLATCLISGYRDRSPDNGATLPVFVPHLTAAPAPFYHAFYCSYTFWCYTICIAVYILVAFAQIPLLSNFVVNFNCILFMYLYIMYIYRYRFITYAPYSCCSINFIALCSGAIWFHNSLTVTCTTRVTTSWISLLDFRHFWLRSFTVCVYSYPVFGQVCSRHAVHMSIAGVVRQVDPQHHRQHQNSEEAQQKYPGPGHPHPVTAGERAAAVALLQRLVPPTWPGHDSEKLSPSVRSISQSVSLSVLTATCPNRAAGHVGGRSAQEVEEGRWLWAEAADSMRTQHSLSVCNPAST